MEFIRITLFKFILLQFSRFQLFIETNTIIFLKKIKNYLSVLRKYPFAKVWRGERERMRLFSSFILKNTLHFFYLLLLSRPASFAQNKTIKPSVF
mgnify:CR=1 FL=1